MRRRSWIGGRDERKDNNNKQNKNNNRVIALETMPPNREHEWKPLINSISFRSILTSGFQGQTTTCLHVGDANECTLVSKQAPKAA